MKKVNKKGFTLIELLAVIIILGVLLLLAVPSVSKNIEKSRMSTYKSSLSSFVDAVATEVNAYEGNYIFATDEMLVVPFCAIDLDRGDNTRSPFGTYLAPNSAVVVIHAASGGGFQYFVSAKDSSNYGTPLVELKYLTVSALTNDTGLLSMALGATAGATPTVTVTDVITAANPNVTKVKTISACLPAATPVTP